MTAQVNGALAIFAAIVAVILLVDNIISKGKERQPAGLEEFTRIKGNQYLQAMLICGIVACLCDAQTYFLTDSGQNAYINAMMFILYAAYFILLTCSTHYFACILPLTTRWGWRLVRATIPISILGCIVWELSIFNGMFGEINQGEWIRSQLYFAGSIFGVLVIAIDFILFLSKSRELKPATLIVFISFVVIPLLSIFPRRFGLQLLFPGLIISMMMIYVFIDRRAAEERKKLEVENNLAQTSILISQVQPHFMYNAITAIRYLCIKDPHAARDALGDFAQFLRDNLESINNTRPVTLQRELGHVEAYLDLEKLRFGDKINVEYEINEENILMPAMTLQPLVENAVKHGITKKVEGGNIWIKTWSDNLDGIILIKDDGVGFDTEKPVDNEGERKSVGIENIRKRLTIISGGSIEITSLPGEGTKALVKIPKRRRHEEIIEIKEDKNLTGEIEETIETG